MAKGIQISECVRLEDFEQCVELQREVFGLPEVELSPVRHFVVTKNAGGFILGAFDGDRLIGFVLSVPAYLRGERAFYSHMTAIHSDYQGQGLGAGLKWAQRAQALEEGVEFVKWTFEPVKARNAFFNLVKLGATIAEYAENFYGTDYSSTAEIGLASDRLFAEWHLNGKKVKALANGEDFIETLDPVLKIEISNNWTSIVASDPRAALAEQMRIRGEFQAAFAKGLIVRDFQRSDEHPSYVLYAD